MPTSGRCLCGDITYEFDGVPLWCAYCHCESCRRQTASPVAVYLGVKAASFRVTRGTMTHYASSPGVRRSFCGTCGTPLSYQGDRWPDEVHLFVGSLSDPAAVRPSAHVNVAEKLPWFEVADNLRRVPHMGA